MDEDTLFKYTPIAEWPLLECIDRVENVFSARLGTHLANLIHNVFQAVRTEDVDYLHRALRYLELERRLHVTNFKEHTLTQKDFLDCLAILELHNIRYIYEPWAGNGSYRYVYELYYFFYGIDVYLFNKTSSADIGLYKIEEYLRTLMVEMESNPVCRFCGCTKTTQCPSGCHWIDEDLCSACIDKARAEYAKNGQQYGLIAEDQ